MSLTSYRTAPSRARLDRFREFWGRLFRFGGDLLSHVLRRSTIGAAALNGRVRDGIGCFARAMTTKPGKTSPSLSAKRNATGGESGSGNRNCVPHLTKSGCGYRLIPELSKPKRCAFVSGGRPLPSTGSNQAYRAISTGQLNALLRLHLRPIDVVVYHGPQGYLVSRGASRLDAFSGYPVRS